jgi:hypothetical protein
MLLLIMAVATWRNSVLAKQKEQNVFAWGVYTILACFAGVFLGMVVGALTYSRDVQDITKLNIADEKLMNALAQQLAQYMSNNLLAEVTLDVLAIGGGLLVRYLLERKPSKKEPEVHWMDRMDDQL